jgi:hypothetical protein
LFSQENKSSCGLTLPPSERKSARVGLKSSALILDAEVRAPDFAKPASPADGRQ